MIGPIDRSDRSDGYTSSWEWVANVGKLQISFDGLFCFCDIASALRWLQQGEAVHKYVDNLLSECGASSDLESFSCRVNAMIET